MSENLRRYTKALYAFDAVAARVPADAWENQSPCTEWNARQVAGHASWVAQMVGATAAGTEVARDRTEIEVAGDDPAATVRATVDSTLAALDQSGVLQKIAQTPFGEIPVDAFLGLIFVDTVAHTWDLAAAAGVPHGLDNDLAAQAHATLAPISDMLRGPGRFDAIVEVADDADELTKFIAFTGRQPQ
jgi:uncharacterized protein (TIGR03086 family)